MGFLDDLFSKSQKVLNGVKQIQNEVKQFQDATECVQPEPVPVSTGNEPDLPVPFGYKCCWLCVKAGSPEEVIEKLALKNPEPANWDKGIEMAYNNYYFVSPVLDEYVLVVGWGSDIISLAPELLDDSAKKFPELQYFATHRVVDYHAWVKYVDGEMIRGYGYCGCDGVVLLNKGGLTPEEERMGFINLIPDNECDWQQYDSPDEEYVMQIAAAWGVDPSFGTKEYPRSIGFICK